MSGWEPSVEKAVLQGAWPPESETDPQPEIVVAVPVIESWKLTEPVGVPFELVTVAVRVVLEFVPLVKDGLVLEVRLAFVPTLV